MKVEKIIQKDSLTIRLVAVDCTTPFSKGTDIDVYAVVSDDDGIKKVVSHLDGKAIPKNMSVEKYKKSKLRGIFYYITYADYLKICQELINLIRQPDCQLIPE